MYHHSETMSETGVFILYSCCVFVGFLLAAFAVWTTFGSEPPLNCRLAVLNTVLMAPLELGGFLVRKRGLSKQDILVVMFVWLLISVFYFLTLQTVRLYVVTPQC